MGQSADANYFVTRHSLRLPSHPISSARPLPCRRILRGGSVESESPRNIATAEISRLPGLTSSNAHINTFAKPVHAAFCRTNGLARLDLRGRSPRCTICVSSHHTLHWTTCQNPRPSRDAFAFLFPAPHNSPRFKVHRICALSMAPFSLEGVATPVRKVPRTRITGCCFSRVPC
ncbi:hypothetical protein BC628DRAFT_67189 [Trametes gibbosa]|nr:hypothetical protein BC628DRAFT_67189 [Trametes gibbosa]